MAVWWHPDGVVEASVAIRDGRILAIGAPDTMPAATETFDAA
jgi:dihydroorotase